jgi:type III restriction enzyme
VSKRAKKVERSVSLDFAFFNELLFFYKENRTAIRRSYKELTKRFLDFNDPSKPGAFLRTPQFEALEIYIFLKEASDNVAIHTLFDFWHKAEGIFRGRASSPTRQGQIGLFSALTEENYRSVMARLKAGQRMYPNYIFALTMGTGKTILMATCIFYEFILANKWPRDRRYCHNALVFAPDRTVLNSLKEIQSFDLSKVVPPEYINFLQTHIQFHYLEEAGTTLSVLDKSRFNIVVSNTQKIILKKQHREKTAVDRLFSQTIELHRPTQSSVYDEIADLYLDQGPSDESELATNQRFEKLKRLEQLGIYVDEAHHAFGDTLAKDMGLKDSKTSLRVTIDELSAALNNSGTRVVACYNYTGTPYVGRDILPEVVYAYGLRDAIENEYLKKIEIDGFENVRTSEFVKAVVDDFLKEYAGKTFEGMLPKIAFFASDIEDLERNLKPAIEKALNDRDVDTSRILVNVGDEKITTNDDIREFNRLDTSTSQKQFILLVNKGREGWNCRSLFGVALFRQPKSKIFVLQATMRCLRSITDVQQTGRVYLGQENLEILDDELKQNFRISADELMQTGKKKVQVEVRPLPPPIEIKLKRIRKTYRIREKDINSGLDLELSTIDLEGYRAKVTRFKGLEIDTSGDLGESKDISHYREKLEFSDITLVAEVSRYLNKAPLIVDKILSSTKEGIPGILNLINQENEVLYDHIIPKLFRAMYELDPEETHEEHTVELVKQPPSDPGCYLVSADPKKIVSATDELAAKHKTKSFHLDHYCFDSEPERFLFWDLLQESRVKKVWFTGMLTHGQSDFFIQYIDPDTHAVRSYYPDFIYVDEKGVYNIVEVKGDNMIDDPVVQAKKEYAEQMLVASGMTYKMIKGSEAMKREYRKLFS